VKQYRVSYGETLVFHMRAPDPGEGKRLAFADASRPSRWQEPLQVPRGVAAEGLAIRWMRWHALAGGAYAYVRQGQPFDVDKVRLEEEPVTT